MDKQKDDSSGKKQNDEELYKYHKTVKEGDTTEEYPDKPKNHTTTDERLIDPDRGEH